MMAQGFDRLAGDRVRIWRQRLSRGDFASAYSNAVAGTNPPTCPRPSWQSDKFTWAPKL